MIILLVLVLTACSPVDCDSRNPEDCTGKCDMCTKAPHTSALECLPKEYCDRVFQCVKKYAEEGPDGCTEGCSICPPCEECSSIGCFTDEYCQELGFEPDWYSSVRPKD